MTYLEALSELQQHGIDALKVALAMQLTALATTRECTAALTESSLPALGVPAVVTNMTSSLTSVAFQMLEQQIAFAKELSDSLVPTRVEPELLRQSETTAPPTVAQPVAIPGLLDDSDAALLIEKRPAGAEAWLDVTMAAADQSEALSKALPAPRKPMLTRGPRVSTDDPTAQKAKLPTVSGDAYFLGGLTRVEPHAATNDEPAR